MGRTFEDALHAFRGNRPATSHEIAAVQALLGKSLPIPFRVFLEVANGGEGFHGPHYAMLWSAVEIVELNEAYQVRTYAPGFLFIGSNGGGEAYALDARDSSMPVVRMPFVGMIPTLAQPIEPSFSSFLQQIERKTAAHPGMEVFEITPIILGGDPTDPANKTLLTRPKHIECVRWWNKIVSDARNNRRQ